MSYEAIPLSLSEIRSDEYEKLQSEAYLNDIARLHEHLDEFVHVSCPACSADNAIFRFEKYRCQFVECRECKTLYMTPRPSPEVMNKYYATSENYAIWNKYIFPKSEANRREKICRPNLDRVVSECRQLGLLRPRLLEIGPGFGTFAALAEATNFFDSVTVVERTPDMAQACRSKGLEVIEASLEEIGTEQFSLADVAVCFEVIEHVFAPRDFLSGVNKLLKPGACSLLLALMGGVSIR